MVNVEHPKVFISYSWEDESHKTWVKNLADKLLADGIDATVDQYDLSLGDRLPQFMEQSISDADYVLIICTPVYKVKSDARKGGVGYEGHIISAELFSGSNEKKFIPVIRKGTVIQSLPKCLSGKLGIDLTDGKHYENGYIEKMPIDSVSPIASILGVTPAYLMGWEDEFGAEKTAAGEGDGLAPEEGGNLRHPLPRLSADLPGGKARPAVNIRLLLSKQG